MLASALVAACGKTPPAEQPAAAEPVVETPAVAPAPAAVDGQKAQLMGGFVPQFAHKVRSQRHEGGTHVVIVEFTDLDAKAIGDALQQELAARRLTVKGPIDRGNGTIRYQAQNSKVGVMTADVSGGGKLKLSEGSKGIVYFSWKDLP